MSASCSLGLDMIAAEMLRESGAMRLNGGCIKVPTRTSSIRAAAGGRAPATGVLQILEPLTIGSKDPAVKNVVSGIAKNMD